jgi:hypothetical protein
MTKLSATLPDDHGLGAIARQLVDEPETVHVVLALVDTKKITTDVDSGDAEATARIRQLEVIAGEDLQWVERAMRRARERRTGATMLPIELEDDLSQALAGIVDEGEDDEAGEG